jgi:hypothetical protein
MSSPSTGITALTGTPSSSATPMQETPNSPTADIVVDLTWEPKTITTKTPTVIRVWLITNDQRCLDFIKTQLKERKNFKFGFETRKTADYWKEVHEAVEKRTGLACVVCMHCKWWTRHPNADPSMSTSTLKRHIDERCKTFKKIKLSDGRTPGDLFEEMFNIRRPMTTDRLCEEVLKVIVEGNLSFRQAENPALQSLLREAFPSCTVPNRRSVATRLKTEASLARAALAIRFEDVDSKVSIALDAWHSRNNNMEFLGEFPACAEKFVG